MLTIYKFPLLAVTTQRVQIPGLIKILHLAVQGNRVCMWCFVDASKPTKEYTVITHGTGHDAADVIDASYVGSYTLLNDSFVGHVFIKRNITEE